MSGPGPRLQVVVVLCPAAEHDHWATVFAAFSATQPGTAYDIRACDLIPDDARRAVACTAEALPGVLADLAAGQWPA